MIYVSLVGIAGRLVCSYLSDAIGRRAAGMLIGYGGAITMVLAGYLNSVWIGGVSLFFVLVMVPALLRRRQLRDHRPVHRRGLAGRLRASGMGLRLRRRQSGQDHRAARAGADHRFVQLRQPEGDARRDRAGVPVPGVLVCARRDRVLAGGVRDEGPLDRGDRRIPGREPYRRRRGPCSSYPCQTETRSRTDGLAAGEPPPTCVPTYRNPTMSLSGSRPERLLHRRVVGRRAGLPHRAEPLRARRQHDVLGGRGGGDQLLHLGDLVAALDRSPPPPR